MTPLLQNCIGSETSLQTILKNQQSYECKSDQMADYSLSMEERLALIEKGINNGVAEQYSKWDQINMNVAKFPPDNMVSYEDLERTKSPSAKESMFKQQQCYGVTREPWEWQSIQKPRLGRI